MCVIYFHLKKNTHTRTCTQVPKKDLPLSLKILAGGLSGTVSQGIANPCDVVKVRMMAPPGKSNTATTYRWFLGSLIQIGKSEGLSGLYKGVTANVGRAASLAAAEMSVYDQVKTTLLYEYEWGEGLKLHAFSATCSGFAAAFASCPFDVCKSRLMSQPVDPVTGQGTMYRGLADCMTKTLAKEGPTAFWKGFLPAWARVGPRVTIIFIMMEQLRKRFD